MQGVYDGRSLRLLVDGACVAERAANGRIPLGRAREIAVGRLASDAGGQFPGVVSHVRITAGRAEPGDP